MKVGIIGLGTMVAAIENQQVEPRVTSLAKNIGDIVQSVWSAALSRPETRIGFGVVFFYFGSVRLLDRSRHFAVIAARVAAVIDQRNSTVGAGGKEGLEFPAKILLDVLHHRHREADTLKRTGKLLDIGLRFRQLVLAIVGVGDQQRNAILRG